MHKHISFTIAATMMGLAIVFWAKASVVENNAKVELIHPTPNVSNIGSSLLTEPHGLLGRCRAPAGNCGNMSPPPRPGP
jgi:hypothetical protein